MSILQPPCDKPLFDSHIHLFRDGYAAIYGSAWANRDEVALYESLRKVHNIERALVVGFEGEEQFTGNNRDLSQWAQEYSWMVPLEYYDVAKPPLLNQLQDKHHSIFAGISLYVMTVNEAQKLLEWPRSIATWFNKRRSIISLNACPEVIPALEEFFVRYSDCQILISHLGSPGSYREAPSENEATKVLEPVLRLSEKSNIGIKVSGLYAISEPTHDYPHSSSHPFLNQLRDAFGSHRLFWGSDFSPALEHVSFAQTIDAISHLNWPTEEVALIMGGNLKRLLVEK